MAKVSGGSVKRPAAKKVVKKVSAPKRPKAQAAQTSPRRAPTLPSSPNLPRVTGVPQVDLFHAIGTRIAQVTGQGKGRRRK